MLIRSLTLALGLLAPMSAAAEKVTVALDWTLNTNHIGLVVAEAQGLYDKAGLDVELLPYADASSAALLAAGKADFAYVPALSFISARAGGSDITALWATMQHETGRLVYNADNTAITRPADLSGKTYAGFGSDWEKALISTMIETDGGKPDWDTVTLGTGAYEALAAGRVDFTLEVATWEGVNGVLLGRKQKAFAYADYGVPDQQNGYIATRPAVLKDRPATVKAFMQATAEGYAFAEAHPGEAAEMMIAAGDFPNPELVRASMKAIVDGGYMVAPDTPVGKIDAAKLARMAQFLAAKGVLKGADGKPLAEAGETSAWVDESWRD